MVCEEKGSQSKWNLIEKTKQNKKKQKNNGHIPVCYWPSSAAAVTVPAWTQGKCPAGSSARSKAPEASLVFPFQHQALPSPEVQKSENRRIEITFTPKQALVNISQG